MKRFSIAATALVAALLCASPAMAQLDVPVPVTSYISVSGADWAWASPCSFAEPSCGVVDLSYQSTEGWRVPTFDEFLARPTVQQFGTACAAAYFSTTYTHCDFGDPEAGFGVNAQGQPMGYLDDFGYNVTLGGSNEAAETWLIRSSAAVPEPATWAMMLLGFGAIGVAMRRRRRIGYRQIEQLA